MNIHKPSKKSRPLFIGRKTAYLFISHGSRSRMASREVIGLSLALKRKVCAPIFEYAFLDVEQPNIPAGIKACIRQGATHIVVLLNFLNSGEHAVKDIPRLIRATLKDFPRVSVSMTKPIGQHEEILRLFLDIIRKNCHR